MFVKNSWYVAAWSDDITHREPFGRLIVGEPVVFFRTSKGQVVAMEDRCAHRLMPLSLGRITEDDKLICAYHGLTYDAGGKCVHVPGQEGPSSITRRTYPVEERAGLIWVWMGDPELADASNIFDCSWLEDPDWKSTRLYRHAEANFMLLNDNLADLLHVAYLHIPSGGGNEAMGPAKTKLDENGNSYHFVREALDIPPPAGYARLSNVKGNVDRWHIVDFMGPSFYRVHTGVAEAGTGGAESDLPTGNGRWAIAPHHFITPETEKSTHYFQVVGHEWEPSSDSWRFLNSVIDEDVWAIEQQQKSLEIDSKAPMSAIGSDAAMLAMRKITERMIAAEAK